MTLKAKAEIVKFVETDIDRMTVGRVEVGAR